MSERISGHGAAAMTVTPIGIVHTDHRERSTTPVQATLNPGEVGRVLLDPPFRDGLRELDGFDFAWLLTWLAPDPADPVPVSMQQAPFLMVERRRPIGLFAMRGPRRPNPIGLHLVRVVDVLPDGFRFAGVDLLDGTPLLDVKPYAAAIDVPPGHRLADPLRSGWFDEVDLSAAHTPASLRASYPTDERE